MVRFLNNVRYGLRTMATHKSFSAAVVATLAIGIGATVAVFSVTYDVLLRPLPYKEPDRLVRIYEEHPGAPKPPGEAQLSNTVMYPWQTRTTTLEELAAYYGREYTVMRDGAAQRIHGAEASPSLFRLLGVTPQAGRLLEDSDATPGANGFVLISDGLWRDRYGARGDAVGQTLIIDERPHTVVGVAPRGFGFPDHDVQIWTPYEDPTVTDATVQGGMWLAPTLGRLKPGATLEQAEAEGTAIARGMKRPAVADLLFGKGRPVRVRVERVVDGMTAGVRPALLVLAASVFVLLLIACANVTNLLLSRGVARTREFALRAAVGAQRSQIAWQLFTESALYALIGGVAGLALGWVLVKVTPLLAPADFPRLDDVRVDWTLGAFAFLVSTLAALVSGVLPALRSARFDIAHSLHPGDGGAGSGAMGASSGNLRSLLLGGEAALAVMLLIGAALLGRSFWTLTSVDPGYDSSGVLTARVHLPPGSAPQKIATFSEELLDRLRADGRVVSAGAANMAPFNDMSWITGFTLPETLGGGKPTKVRTLRYVVTPGYAEALGLRLREGRLLAASDTAPALLRIMVNREFARQYLSDGPVAGRSFTGGPFKAGTTEIVGVVGDILKGGNADQPIPEIYLLQTAERSIGEELNVVVRTKGDPSGLVSTLRDAVRALDPRAAVGQAAPLVEGVQASVAQPRFGTAVLLTLAAIALLLTSIGLYGVLSYTVAQRRREFGVRLAIGAARRDVLSLVLRQGLSVTAAGLVIGVLAASSLARLLSGLLFGVTPLDGLAYAAAPLLLLPAALLACLAPALRASAVDPSITLRGE